MSVPACDTWDPPAFEAWLARGRAAIDREDVEGHGQAWAELRAALPCLRGPIPTDLWAEWLVGLALVEYAADGAWQPPLTTALRLRPELAGELPAPLGTFAPPAPGPDGPPLPTDAIVRLDGVPVAAEPDLAGLHLLQREQGGTWDTRLVDGGAFPSEWRGAPEPPAPRATPRRPSWWSASRAGRAGRRSGRARATSTCPTAP